MAITLRTAGTWAAITAGGTVTLPTHQAGDMLIVRVAMKSSSASTEDITTNTAGWTKIGQGNNGTTNASNGGGSVIVAAFFKVAESSSETNPTLAFTGIDVAAVVGMAYQKGSTEMWISPAGASGPDTSSGTSHSATIASHVRLYSGDLVDFFTGIADDTTMTVPTFTQTGATLDTVTESPAAALSSTSGFDISADGGYRTVTAGTSTAAAVVTGTLSTAETGTSWQTRLRVMTPPPIGQANARIKAIGINNHAQAQGSIKQTYYVHGQTQAQIKQTYNVHGQAQAYIINTRFVHGQAQAWIEQTYNQHGQANASIKQTYPLCVSGGGEESGGAILGDIILGDVVLGSNPEEGGEDTCIGAFGQAQAWISKTNYVHGQAQALINAGTSVHGQAQAWIESTVNSHGQAQADIKQTYYVHGQANALIANTYFVHGQAQGKINAFGVNRHGQANASIKQTYPLCVPGEGGGDGGGAILGSDTMILGDIVLGSTESGESGEVCIGAFGQAQAEIVVNEGITRYVHGQAQAWIEQTYYQHGQAQAWIENTYFAHGQAQADIKQTYNVHGQAQALIGQRYNVHGQAQGWVENTYNQHGQAQGTIKTTYYQHGQAQGQIKQTYYVHGQCQALISSAKTVHGQAQALIAGQYIHLLDTFTRTVDPVFNVTNIGTPDVGTWYTVFVDNDGVIDGSKVVAQTSGSFNDIFLQGAVDISPLNAYTLSMDVWSDNYDIGDDSTYIELSVADRPFTEGYFLYLTSGELHLEDGAGNNFIPFTLVNGTTYRFMLFVNGTQMKAKVWDATLPEPVAWTIEYTGTTTFNAQRALFDFEILANLGGSMTMDNTSVYSPEVPSFFKMGQAQAYIDTGVRWRHGQARAWIKKIDVNRHGQAQAFIRKSAGYGQAQALITRGALKHGQAQAQIETPGLKSGQAQAFITNTTPNGQAQASILVRTFTVGQAQAYILEHHRWFGQAQAQIRTFANSIHGLAMAQITNTQGYGQAMAFIDGTTYGNVAHGQAQAWIKRTQAYAQAQADIKRTNRSHGLAQALIIRRMLWGQAQGYIRKGTETRVFGQAQGFIEQQNYGHGNAMAMIRKGAGHGQAQARIRAFGQITHGNAQAYIRRTDTRFASGQSMAQIKRNDFTGQAQAYIEGGRYLVQFNEYRLPGYAQIEDFVSEAAHYEPDVAYQDGPFSEYVGLRNKTISLQMKVVGETYLDVKNQVQDASTMVRSSKGWEKLYIQSHDRYYTALTRRINTEKRVGSTMRALDYVVEWEALPWLESEAVYTVSGGTGTFSTGPRTLYEGGWTPATLVITGTNVTVSGYNELGEFTGFVSVSGAVTNMVIDAQAYTSTINGVNSNNQMYNPDYAVFVGPGVTYFTVTGATNVTVQWRNRWYL